LYLAIQNQNKTDKINDVPMKPTMIFKSLSKIKISENDENDLLLSSYNGELSSIVFDKTITHNTE
jgi:hypothetical protein